MIVPDALAGSRADRAVASLCDVGVNAARRLLESGRVTVAGRRIKKGDVVTAGADVLVEGHGAWLVPGPGAVTVIYEDADVIVVDKPAGMPCHPLFPGEGGTVVDALVARFHSIATVSPSPREGGLVHRLDTGTSGCLAIAKTRAAWTSLRASFSDDSVEKRYLAVVEGDVPGPLVVSGAIAHDPRDARRMIVDDSGKDARTEATPIARRHRATLLEVRMHGGRRHQIRAHLAGAGYPLVGDVLYGATGATDTAWHLLHANSLRLPGRPPVTAQVPAVFRAAANARGLEIP